MIIDERTYTIQPTRVNDYLDLYKHMGMAVQTRILGGLIGFYTVEIGDVNQLVHMWSYESIEARARLRSELWANSEWLIYVDALRRTGWLLHQSNRILVPSILPPAA
ncbi:NIPSNAP family protein [Ensifer adhaerens]|uniref:NIPSNAP family protein n=1 Tax=Ensifer adhaerens TaxID=106592 RepID=UPI001CBBB661|nr:NIPSNAP family protein [Ensifer adhaerens]MBZ7924307.1 NIPSNAP family protein [Ensifer adhaerens]UAX96442.1 NIPSNAP family protein [Ensifer adhaerens]UAY04215.1 NIPSNAP family protein [Ensifer adhaerens]UAY12201.1 NIPSNAP family protein [Ensifer adhaerens]